MKRLSTQKFAGNWKHIDLKRRDFRILHYFTNSVMCFDGVESKGCSRAYEKVEIFSIN